MTATALPLLGGDLAACCAPIAGGALDEDAAERLARVFRALGDRHRVRLLSLIAAADGGEACVCDLTTPLGLSQPTVSHHMKQLAEAGLVTREQRGKWAYYRVAPETLLALSDILRGRSNSLSRTAALRLITALLSGGQGLRVRRLSRYDARAAQRPGQAR
jgi:ArsR family transcriptional regulator, arsenate/arsenite/antimonite-responsive transcriptional repressor